MPSALQHASGLMADGAASLSSRDGFVVPNLSSSAPSTSSKAPAVTLPHPRGQPLRPGSSKAEKLRAYAESRMMYINRRYVKKHGLQEPGDEVVGYASLAELVRDAEALVNILWLSGTPSLQIPYLLHIASETTTWLTSFSPMPESTFALLGKLDHCFASLLAGEDISTHETLPGFEQGLRGGMSRTEMVRCRSLVEQTRVLVVKVLMREPRDTDGSGLITDEDSGEDSERSSGDFKSAADAEGDGRSGRALTDDEARLRMHVARVYENSIVRLGDVLEQGDGVPAEVWTSED